MATPYHVLPAGDDDLEREGLGGAVVEAQVALSGAGHDDVHVGHAHHVRHPRGAHFQVR